jgi:hypothetical protein
LIVSGCVPEDFFGLSPFGNVNSLEVTNQASQAAIDNSNNVVTVEMPPGIDLEGIAIRSIEVSSFAESELIAGDTIDLNADVEFNITAEDGSITRWTIRAEVATANPQLDNSDFNLWYQANGGYFEPGENADNTIWGTGNPGTTLLGLYATNPIERAENDNFAARMETLDNGRLPASLGFPISAGTIYTGEFLPDNIDPTDPRAAIDFGTPFAGRPAAFQIEYSYLPGPENKDKNGDALPFDDNCDIYVLLEVRQGDDDIRRLATAWFRSNQVQEELTTLSVNFTYGELDSSYPDFMKPPDGKYVTGDSANFILPSHITFVASSSFDGDNFAGAVGSTLVVDNLQLIYQE